MEGFDKFVKIGVVRVQPGFEFGQLGNNLPIEHKGFPQLYKRTHHEKAHRDRALRVQNSRRHDGSVFGKSVGEMTTATVR